MKKSFAIKSAVVLFSLSFPLLTLSAVTNATAASIPKQSTPFVFAEVNAAEFPGINKNGQVTNVAQFGPAFRARMQNIRKQFSDPKTMGIVTLKGFDLTKQAGEKALYDTIIPEVQALPANQLHLIDLSGNKMTNDEANKLLVMATGQKSDTGISIDLSDTSITDPGAFAFPDASKPAVLYFRDDKLNAQGITHVLNGSLDETTIQINNGQAAQAFHDNLQSFPGYRIQAHLDPSLPAADTDKVIAALTKSGAPIADLNFAGAVVADKTVDKMVALIQKGSLTSLNIVGAKFSDDSAVIKLNNAVAQSTLSAWRLTNAALIESQPISATDFEPLAKARRLKELSIDGAAIGGNPSEFLKTVLGKNTAKLESFSAVDTTVGSNPLKASDLFSFIRQGKLRTAVISNFEGDTANIPSDLYGAKTRDGKEMIISKTPAEAKGRLIVENMGKINAAQCAECGSAYKGNINAAFRVPNTITIDNYTTASIRQNGEMKPVLLRQLMDQTFRLAEIKKKAGAEKSGLRIDTPMKTEEIKILSKEFSKYPNTGIKTLTLTGDAVKNSNITEWTAFANKYNLKLAIEN